MSLTKYKKSKSPLANVISSVENKLIYHPHLVTISTILVCGLIIFLRKPEAFTHAQFWAEDGIVWFGQAYNNGFLHTIFLPYSGTFSIITRLVGSLTVLFPIIYAPLIFSVAGLSGQLLPVFMINSTRFNAIVKYRLVAIAASLMYVCITNSSEVFSNLANIQWHLGIAAFLIVIATKPNTKAWKVFDVTALTLIGLTGPLCLILAIPALVMYLNKREKWNFVHLIILGVTAAVQAVSLFIISPGQRGGEIIIAWVDMVKMISGQIFTAGILGSHNAGLFYDSPLLYIVLIAGLLLSAYAAWKGPSWLRYANMLSLIIFVFMLGSLKPLKGVDVWGILTHDSTGQRYWYIPIFVWLMTVLWLALKAKNRAVQAIGVSMLLLFVAVGVPNSWDIPPYKDRGYPSYANRFDKLESGQSFAIPINPEGWSVVLRKR